MTFHSNYLVLVRLQQKKMPTVKMTPAQQAAAAAEAAQGSLENNVINKMTNTGPPPGLLLETDATNSLTDSQGALLEANAVAVRAAVRSYATRAIISQGKGLVPSTKLTKLTIAH